MKGHVDSYGRALVNVRILLSSTVDSHEIGAWIDTGFNGDLVLPQRLIDDLALPQSGTVKAILADGSEIALSRYTCLIDWLDDQRELEVVANSGEFPLLGVGLLVGFDLHISYRSGLVVID